MRKKVVRTEQQWQEQLTPEQYRVTRLKGTERPFTGEYDKAKDRGLYCCVACGNPLYSSDTKYESGSGWPSFWAAIDEDAVRCEEDSSLGVRRTEVRCAACDAHLGHVFEDGPPPTGKRFCMNSVSLRLDREGEGEHPS